MTTPVTPSIRRRPPLSRRLAASIALILSVFFASPGSFAADLDSASFWTGRMESAEMVLLGPEGIDRLNRETLARTNQMADVLAMPESIDGDTLTAWLLFDPLPDWRDPGKKRFLPDGRVAGERFFRSVERNIDSGAVAPQNPVRFGVVTHRADLRAFPSSSPLYKSPRARGFDTVQYSSIAPAEPVALLHASADGEWGFFQTRHTRGWLRMDDVAFGAREAVSAGLSAHGASGDDFVVMTGSRVPVYADAGLKAVLSELPMGSVLKLSGGLEGDGPWRVLYPSGRDGSLDWITAYLEKGDGASRGYLPYTPASVITQAFRMLGEEYGWGGSGGRRDCSAFVRDVFLTVGVSLPRNSALQGASGAPLFDGSTPEAALSAILGSAPGATLVALDGHIMIYIGELDGTPHVIHQTFGYAEAGRFRMINRAVVTAIAPAGPPEKGPYAGRVRFVTVIGQSAGIEAASRTLGEEGI